MILLALGLGLVAALFWGAGAFARAPVGSVKALLAWVVALAALSLVALLALTGRGGLALSGLVLGGPLVWRFWRRHRAASRLSRAEALAVLGLREGASNADIQAAWMRLMPADGERSDWLAARVNLARDVLRRR